MITNTVYECAASYLYSPVRYSTPDPTYKKSRKVEATNASNTKKSFNKNAATKSNFDGHIDICI